MHLLDYPRYYKTRGTFNNPDVHSLGNGYFAVTFATGIGRLIELFATNDNYRAFGGYGDHDEVCMGIYTKSTDILSSGKVLDRENGDFLRRIEQTLRRFQWWEIALECGEGIDDLGIAYPARTKTFEPEVPEELPQTNFHRALLALSWSLGRQLSVDPREFDQHNTAAVASALSMAIEQELTDGTPFEETLHMLFE